MEDPCFCFVLLCLLSTLFLTHFSFQNVKDLMLITGLLGNPFQFQSLLMYLLFTLLSIERAAPPYHLTTLHFQKMRTAWILYNRVFKHQQEQQVKQSPKKASQLRLEGERGAGQCADPGLAQACVLIIYKQYLYPSVPDQLPVIQPTPYTALLYSSHSFSYQVSLYQLCSPELLRIWAYSSLNALALIGGLAHSKCS